MLLAATRPPVDVGMMQPVVVLLVPATVCTCSKSQKSLEALLTEIGYVSIPRYNSRAVCGAHLALRGEILQLHELRRQVSRTRDRPWATASCLHADSCWWLLQVAQEWQILLPRIFCGLALAGSWHAWHRGASLPAARVNRTRCQ